MTKPDDGGYAFPRPASTDAHETACNVYQDQSGMTLRDWFAGQAMVGFAASTEFGLSSEKQAQFAYDLADAMLTARKRELK